MSIADNKAVASRWITDLWSNRSLEAAQAAADEVIAADFVNHSAPPGLPPGRAGLQVQLGLFYTAFPDIYGMIDELIAEGDRVVIRWHGGGTNTGELFGMPPTRRAMTLNGIAILRVADGQLAEHWASSDDLGMMRQLGLIPS